MTIYLVSLPSRTTGFPYPFLSQEKKQTTAQQEQASIAITLYYEIQNTAILPDKVTPPQFANHPASITFNDKTDLSLREAPAAPIQYKEVAPPPSPDSVSSPMIHTTSNNVNPLGKTAAKPQNRIESTPPSQMGLGHGASWKAEYSRLADEIHLRHYSSKTLQTYQGWAKQFQAFTHSKAPELLSTDDVKEFITFLAVKRKVAATTQNQAFNALLFFYRHVLRKEFGKVDGVVRAKRKPYIPVVLSREEINAVLKHLAPPYDLVVKLTLTEELSGAQRTEAEEIPEREQVVHATQLANVPLQVGLFVSFEPDVRCFDFLFRISRRLKGRSSKYTDRPARLSDIPFRSRKFAEPDKRNWPGCRRVSTTRLMAV